MNKIEREKEIVECMIKLYCKKKDHTRIYARSAEKLWNMPLKDRPLQIR